MNPVLHALLIYSLAGLFLFVLLSDEWINEDTESVLTFALCAALWLPILVAITIITIGAFLFEPDPPGPV